MEPSSLSRERPRASIASADSFVGFAILVMMLRSAVPALDALMPELAIRPVAMAMSSMVYPMAPATVPAYLNVSPIISTFVLEFMAACAMTSTILAVSSASMWNAVRTSVTMSDAMARSSPDAAARSSTPLIPAIICSVFQPAIPIYSMAFPTSVALNTEVCPSSLALSSSCASSSAVAPLIA